MAFTAKSGIRIRWITGLTTSSARSRTCPIASEGDDVLVLLDLYYQPLMDYFRHFYPDAAVEVVKYRNEIPLYIRIQVPLEDLYAIQGLEAVYTPRSGSAEDAAGLFDRRELGRERLQRGGMERAGAPAAQR